MAIIELNNGEKAEFQYYDFWSRPVYKIHDTKVVLVDGEFYTISSEDEPVFRVKKEFQPCQL